MAKVAYSQSNVPESRLPKVYFDALLAAQKENLATVQEAQSVLVDAAQAVVRLQHGWVEESVAGALRARQPGKPEAAAAEAKVVAAKAVSVTKQGLDVTAAAQRRVVELFGQRTRANVDVLKTLAA